MKFSIIMPSYLGDFKNAAKHRPDKFLRALESIEHQTCQDFECIVIADGCRDTETLFNQYYCGNPKFSLYKLPKQRLWSPKVRNEGIKHALGEYITYLDTDDKLGARHLEIILYGIKDYDWAWYNDYLVDKFNNSVENLCDLKFGKCGTSNFTHKRSLGAVWEDATYAHDYRFLIRQLKKHPNNAKIATPQYYICHQPGKFDV